ncbi:ABC transporter ATP-binding protein [Pseudonocardia xinjiangensis]|uniref:ABC transporter ATP-binding protein n=1 Tax=Pseudonocardia xinjiangensis TaxID=75289 RepID=A0ABX1R8T3_9PSEU|nr:ABC transporter ATP-binding protein [Pseudonocardia xinjiangensis]NMH76432.1 ABC transporter ATP-binding protein [Pseudonocardia xinjiangensis]
MTMIDSDVLADPGLPPGPDDALLEVSDLEVSFPSEDGRVRAVRGISYRVAPGEVLGIVGESGSGKSVSSLAVMGLLPPSAKISGSIRLRGQELLGLSDTELSRIRGRKIAMVFQDPLSALTPVYTVGDQIAEALLVHGGRSMTAKAAAKRSVELLDLVGIPNATDRVNAFPHEFSGGMRQRAVIAMAIANDPDLIIADEPTTALDVTVQAQVLEVLKTAQEVTGAGIVLITHDLGVVAGTADRVVVMYAGKAVETGTVDEIFAAPRMPYTLGLLGSIPRLDIGRGQPLVPIEGQPPSMVALPPGCPFGPRCPLHVDACDQAEPELLVAPGASGDHRAACIRTAELAEADAEGGELAAEVFDAHVVDTSALHTVPRTEREVVLGVDGLVKHYPVRTGSVFRRKVGAVQAVDGVTFDVRAGETLGLVGESGCGKSTTILEIMGLEPPMGGSVQVLGSDITGLSKADRKRIRRDLQIVFQDPMASLDPRLPVRDLIAEPLEVQGFSKEQIAQRVPELMRLVGLRSEQINRYPGEFSGGQRQRICIARALALEPKVLVLDEPVSALDVSIQAGVLNLLDELKVRLGLAYLFVAHDLSVVRHIADRVAVMYLGKIVEIGSVDEVFAAPQHPYTQALLSAIPVPDPEVERRRERVLLHGDMPSPANPPSGCRFRTRCPLFLTLDADQQARCIGEEPLRRPAQPAEPGTAVVDHEAACHWARIKTVV